MELQDWGFGGKRGRNVKWPRGKYNGRRIVGIEFKIRLDVTRWYLVPVCGGGVWKFSGGFYWLCFMTWTNWNYEES